MSELTRLRQIRDKATISELYDLIGELESEIERLTRERDAYRSVAIREVVIYNTSWTRTACMKKVDAWAEELQAKEVEG